MSGPEKDTFLIPTPGRLRKDFLLSGKTPFWIISTVLIIGSAAVTSLTLIARSRAVTSDKPRVHLVLDMAIQPKYSTQQPSSVFVDGRSMRPPVPGTVARGMLGADDHFERGFELVKAGETEWQVNYFNGFPRNVPVDERTLTRGKKMFDIYCAPCHGLDGYGHGPVNERATRPGKEEPKWIPAANLHTDEIRSRADGHIYNTIHNGIRSMPAYGPQIETKDRWAIVAYVRALQRSQNATLDDVPTEARGNLK